MPRISILVFVLAIGFPAVSVPQELDLATMTQEQRWDRASYNLSLFATVYLQKGIATGMAAEEVGRELATHLGPWPRVTTPEDMAATIFRNWQSWRTLEFQARKNPDGVVVVLTNRPYSAAIERYSKIGVTVAEFDAMFGAFHAEMARAQGLVFRQSVHGDSTVQMTISSGGN